MLCDGFSDNADPELAHFEDEILFVGEDFIGVCGGRTAEGEITPAGREDRGENTQHGKDLVDV